MELEPEQLFLDDFSAGQTYPGQPRTMTKDDILSFAALTGDAHPIHYDDEYAKSTRFGRPIVHGLHLMALTALGATPLSAQLTDSMIAMWTTPCGRKSRSRRSTDSRARIGESWR
jgi:3-hydroxybutyryl-CoA dehydratase